MTGSGPYSSASVRQYGAAKVVCLALLLAVALLVAISLVGCTPTLRIENLVLYQNQPPCPCAPPVATITPSGAVRPE